MMKIKFNPNLDFQREAINAVVDVFDGQEICQTNFTVAPLKRNAQMDWLFTDLGIGNRLRLLEDDIHKNVREVQLRNRLPPSEGLDSTISGPCSRGVSAGSGSARGIGEGFLLMAGLLRY